MDPGYALAKGMQETYQRRSREPDAMITSETDAKVKSSAAADILYRQNGYVGRSTAILRIRIHGTLAISADRGLSDTPLKESQGHGF